MTDTGGQTLWVAIIGSGPAGYYTAEALVKNAENIKIDILDRLPTPFGLIRGGVAPDHQSIKAVARRYEKTASQENVHFVGNLNIGSDITIDDLRVLYDVVVLANGAPKDLKLGLPGEDKAGVIGSAEFVGWYNSHPDFTNLNPNLNIENVIVIGNGNVAVDCARILAKTAKEMAGTDLAQHAANLIHPAPIENIYLAGRRGPLEGKFTPKELGELGQLENCVALVDPKQIPDDLTDVNPRELTVKGKNLTHLKKFIGNTPSEKSVKLHIMFYASPIEILGKEKVTGIKFEKTKVEDGKCVGLGEYFEIPCKMVLSAIGYKSTPISGAPFDGERGRFKNDEGFIESGLYTVGWAKRGPSGTIGTNKPDGIAVAKLILEQSSPSGKKGRIGLDELVSQRGLKIVTFKGWKKIESAEEKAAEGLAPRAKFAHIEDMLKILD
ncbi:MAG: FAD-dependent oxidoreductase [Sphingomonadales bacterium]